MNSTEIMSVTVNPGEASEVRDADIPETDLETPDNPQITSSFEEIESATQAHTEGPNSGFNRYWQKYHTVLGHVIIWVLSTSCGDTYLRN